MYYISLTSYYAEWCKVYCCETNRTHVISAKALEPEDSEILKITDMSKGNTLLWKFKGKRYSVTFLEVYGKCYVVV